MLELKRCAQDFNTRPPPGPKEGRPMSERSEREFGAATSVLVQGATGVLVLEQGVSEVEA